MPEFKVGDRVRVKADGPWYPGVVGTVDELLDSGWLTVMLTGRSFPAAFMVDELEPLPAQQEEPA